MISVRNDSRSANRQRTSVGGPPPEGTEERLDRRPRQVAEEALAQEERGRLLVVAGTIELRMQIATDEVDGDEGDDIGRQAFGASRAVEGVG